ncbi:hypothetical protein EXIGLDRAFT_835025 [Exidia glandulosa HHB12029]|uniref:F-box domain-containing protein n=1 Tax=Exidia glandulosa HHB12029 TaxID=1314781 RepID=A0A165J750_EXIGL|nr:hypothetical protein EXIGLDRAFT_835025 [Exidia glandulosa HHB12029]
MAIVLDGALNLPVEMRREIALQCERGDLASLSRVHSMWNRPCEAVLYGAIALGAVDTDDNRVLELLHALATRGKASLVRSFFVTCLRDPVDYTAREVRIQHFNKMSKAYRDALAQMVNLVDLRVPVWDADVPNDILSSHLLPIISARTFRLKSLVYPYPREGRSLDAFYSAIIPHKTSLKCLGLAHRDCGLEWGGGYLPRFAHFQNSGYSVFELVDWSGSELSDIRLCPVLDVSLSVWDSEEHLRDIQLAVDACLTNDRRFTMAIAPHLHSIIPTALRHLSNAFPRIGSLTLVLLEPAVTDSEDPTTSLSVVCAAIVDALMPFAPHLVELKFTATEISSRDSHLGWLPIPMRWLTDHEHHDLLRQASSRCQNLRSITFPCNVQYKSSPDTPNGWEIVRENFAHDFAAWIVDDDPYFGSF